MVGFKFFLHVFVLYFVIVVTRTTNNSNDDNKANGSNEIIASNESNGSNKSNEGNGRNESNETKETNKTNVTNETKKTKPNNKGNQTQEFQLTKNRQVKIKLFGNDDTVDAITVNATIDSEDIGGPIKPKLEGKRLDIIRKLNISLTMKNLDTDRKKNMKNLIAVAEAVSRAIVGLGDKKGASTTNLSIVLHDNDLKDISKEVKKLIVNTQDSENLNEKSLRKGNENNENLRYVTQLLEDVTNKNMNQDSRVDEPNHIFNIKEIKSDYKYHQPMRRTHGGQEENNIKGLKDVTDLLEKVTVKERNEILRYLDPRRFDRSAITSDEDKSNTQSKTKRKNKYIKKRQNIYDPYVYKTYHYGQTISSKQLKKLKSRFKKSKGINRFYEFNLINPYREGSQEKEHLNDFENKIYYNSLLRGYKKYEATPFFNFDVEHITGCIEDTDQDKCKTAKNELKYAVTTLMPKGTTKYLNEFDDFSPLPIVNKYNYKEIMKKIIAHNKKQIKQTETRKILPYFQPKRIHWEGDVDTVDGFWYNGPQGRYSGSWKALLI